MELTEKQKLELKKHIIIEGKKIYDEIYSMYVPFLLNDEKRNALNQFGGEIIVDDYNEDDIKLFGSINRVPPGHAGRRKKDNKIHIYPYSPQLSYISDFDELKETIVSDVVVHEMFHFYAQPDIYDQSDKDHQKDSIFGHRLTEGIVQYFTNIYINEHKLNGSKTTYIEEVLLVQNIIDDLTKQGKSKEEIIGVLLNKNQIEILAECTNGDLIKNEYLAKLEFHQATNDFLRKNLIDLQNDREQQDFYRYCLTSTNIDMLYDVLKTKFPQFVQSIDEIYKRYNDNSVKQSNEKSL